MASSTIPSGIEVDFFLPGATFAFGPIDGGVAAEKESEELGGWGEAEEFGGVGVDGDVFGVPHSDEAVGSECEVEILGGACDGHNFFFNRDNGGAVFAEGGGHADGDPERSPGCAFEVAIVGFLFEAVAGFDFIGFGKCLAELEAAVAGEDAEPPGFGVAVARCPIGGF